MEPFYREQRRRYGVLMRGDEPEGGRWNFDDCNREAFGAAGPGVLPLGPDFEPDAVTCGSSCPTRWA
jgi:deoxyribodipyrimidine photolyase-related protein